MPKKMMKSVDSLKLWPGVHAFDVTIDRHVDMIDVTAFGMDKPQYVQGMAYESVDLHLACDFATYEFLMTLLQTPVKDLGCVTPPPASDELKDVPFRKIVLE